MTEAQIITAAHAAIRAMDDKARAAFIAMVEAGQNETAQTVAQAYAAEGVSRQIRMASTALEQSHIMDGLVELVGERLGA